jgi:hypothetical protein
LPCSLLSGFCIGHALRWSLVKRRL